MQRYMIVHVLAYLGSQYKISRSWMDVLINYVLLFGVVNLDSCHFAMDPTAIVLQIVYKSSKNCDGDPGNN
jgi:hypothetical protein